MVITFDIKAEIYQKNISIFTQILWIFQILTKQKNIRNETISTQEWYEVIDGVVYICVTQVGEAEVCLAVMPEPNR